jgi:hypothetical protein
MNTFTIIYLILNIIFTSFGIWFIIESILENKKRIIIGVVSIIFIILNFILMFLCILQINFNENNTLGN